MRQAARSRDESSLVGHYAGPVSRLVGYVLDASISTLVFTGGVTVSVFLINLVLGTDLTSDSLPGWVWAGGFLGWLLIYYGYCWAAVAKTPGMALVGIQIVRRDGSELTPGRGIARTFAYPLSFLTLGLGFVGIIIGREHRALHDVIADTTVVYGWDARSARLRFLVRNRDAETPQILE